MDLHPGLPLDLVPNFLFYVIGIGRICSVECLKLVVVEPLLANPLSFEVLSHSVIILARVHTFAN